MTYFQGLSIPLTGNIHHNCKVVALEQGLPIIIFFSPTIREGYRQVFTKIDKHHLCKLNNVILQNLSGLDLARRSQSHVKGHRRGGVCVLRMLLVQLFFVKTHTHQISLYQFLAFHYKRNLQNTFKYILIWFYTELIWPGFEPKTYLIWPHYSRGDYIHTKFHCTTCSIRLGVVDLVNPIERMYSP